MLPSPNGKYVKMLNKPQNATKSEGAVNDNVEIENVYLGSGFP